MSRSGQDISSELYHKAEAVVVRCYLEVEGSEDDSRAWMPSFN